MTANTTSDVSHRCSIYDRVVFSVETSLQNSSTTTTFTVAGNVLRGEKKTYEMKHRSCAQMLYGVMKKNRSRVVQVDAGTGEEDTYGEMLDRAVRCALWLRKQGVKRGDIVAVATHNHLDSFVPCVAAVFIGAIVNPWDAGMNAGHARHFMSLTEPKVIFANEQAARVALEAAKAEGVETKTVVFGDRPGTVAFTDVLQGHSDFEVASFRYEEVTDLRDTSLIMFSSGTTGLPKGVQMSHDMLLRLLENKDLEFGNMTPLWFSPIFWITGCFLNFMSLASGAKKIVATEFDPQKLCEILVRYKITWLMLSTSMSNRFVRYKDLPSYDLSSLDQIMIGGATLKQESQDALKKHLPHTSVIQCYGMTELGGLAMIQNSNGASGSCGTVVPNCELKIVDVQTGESLGPNLQGELCVKTPNVMIGYYKNPTATMEILDEDGWIHTGDLAYYNEDGEVFIVDRLKEIIKYRGHQIAPTEIEDLLQAHPAVMEAAVVGIPHPTDDDHPVAFVSKMPNKEVTEEELVTIVEKNFIDAYKLRGGVKFLPSLPHTSSGKVLRIALKNMAKSLALQ
ncbi:luciferin 4-monooxygenase isoform X1 [Megalopta genalis]|uniref:luciferin 4-monooxygenase isoform X1 n=2 Tax=Megalopta genalis TaxID=115081 RepID=UPI003FD5E562